MGPIMQERTASTTLKRVVSKEKIGSKKGNKMKKAVGQVKNSPQGQVRIRTQCQQCRSPEEEGDLRPQLRKHSSVQRKEEKRENQRMSQCSNELQPNRGGMGKNRRALSLPLPNIRATTHAITPLTHSPAPTPEALQQHYNHKDDDTDSASDLSDSERLPVLPSPCTPAPLLTSTSVREGRGAPRPKPVGPLEKYLERLLQLEWLQIQTVQAESSRPPGTRPRPQGFPSATTAHPPRPHTAPPSRLNSPKGLRHSQRAFPFAPVNNPHRLPHLSTTSPATQFVLIVTFATLCVMEAALPMPTSATHGSVHYLSAEPDLGHQRSEAAVRPEHPPQKEGAQEERRRRCQTPVAHRLGGVISGTCRLQAMPENNPRNLPQTAEVSKREVSTSKRVEKDWQRTEAGGQASKTAMKRAAKEPQSLSKAPLS
ncbi:hypothetical protein INR49_022409, partial [Caranx melampygus]